MAQTLWLEESNIVFPAENAITLLGLRYELPEGTPVDLDAAIMIVREYFEHQLDIIDLEIEKDSNGEPTRFLTLAYASSNEEWGSHIEIKHAITRLAPVIPDGSYIELDSSNPEVGLFRLIIDGDEIFVDHPSIVWDSPLDLLSARRDASQE